MASVRVNKYPNFTGYKIAFLLEPIGLNLSWYTLRHCGAGRRKATNALIERNERMSDQEMIKRVADAIRIRDTTDEFAMARAAIKAMREPTEKMKTLVTDEIVITDKCYYCGGHIQGWQAMIDMVIDDA